MPKRNKPPRFLMYRGAVYRILNYPHRLTPFTKTLQPLTENLLSSIKPLLSYPAFSGLTLTADLLHSIQYYKNNPDNQPNTEELEKLYFMLTGDKQLQNFDAFLDAFEIDVDVSFRLKAFEIILWLLKAIQFSIGRDQTPEEYRKAWQEVNHAVHRVIEDKRKRQYERHKKLDLSQKERKEEKRKVHNDKLVAWFIKLSKLFPEEYKKDYFVLQGQALRMTDTEAFQKWQEKYTQKLPELRPSENPAIKSLRRLKPQFHKSFYDPQYILDRIPKPED